MADQDNFRDFSAVGISISESQTGRIRIACPFCGPNRTHRPHERCLSVDTDKGLYHCYHCGESGYVPTKGEQKARAKQQKQREERLSKKGGKGTYSRPKAFAPEFLINHCLEAPDAQPLIRFLTEERKLNLDLLQRYRITLPYASFPSKEAAKEEDKPSYTLERAIAFPFFDRGDYINVKHRTLDKRFTLHPKGELIPWNIDALIHKPICYITEGEFDALTLIQCGYLETISVPNGAQTNLSFLDRFVETHLEDKIRIILALDNDERGIVLRNELIRRLDPERCQLVEWPEGCKDANDVLMQYGEERVRMCIEAAHDIPLVGIQTAEDVEEELWQLFRQGLQRGAAARIAGVDELITFETGRYMVVSGRPGDGKSEFIDELCLRMALLYDWRVAYFSPENVPVTYHLRKLCEKLTRYPFQPSSQFTDELLKGCVSWLSANVCHILPGFGEDGLVDFDEKTLPSSAGNASNERYTLDNILDIAHRAVARRGVRIFVIDPLNRIEQDQQDGKSELQWYAHVNNTLSRFARRHQCLVILVAHPRKVNRAHLDGKKRRVEMNDINGSADFGNKADYCLIVDRDDDLQVVTLYVDKVKFKHLGSRGECLLHYDKLSGRYLPCQLRKLDPATHPLPKQGSVCVTLPTGVQYEKSIDLRNHQCCWINASGEPILQTLLDRFNVRR